MREKTMIAAGKPAYEYTWTAEVGGFEIWLGILARGSNDDHEREEPPAVYVAGYELYSLEHLSLCRFGNSAADAVAQLLNAIRPPRDVP